MDKESEVCEGNMRRWWRLEIFQPVFPALVMMSSQPYSIIHQVFILRGGGYKDPAEESFPSLIFLVSLRFLLSYCLISFCPKNEHKNVPKISCSLHLSAVILVLDPISLRMFISFLSILPPPCLLHPRVVEIAQIKLLI